MFYHLLHYDFSQMTWKIVTEHKNGKSFTTTSWNPKEITEIQKKKSGKKKNSNENMVLAQWKLP